MDKTLEIPIGVFDSGVGGLTVLRELFLALPHESFVYFGDTARLPYGDKSRDTVIRYSVENAIFLMEKNIKALVVACNTASAYALEKLQQMFNIPVIGVIDPGANRAVEVSTHGRIAVLGTKGTIHSQSYQKAICDKDPSTFVLPIACPLFVPLVEERYVDHPATRLIIQDYLKPLKEQDIDTLLLGCTHYPLLKHLIRNEVGDSVSIVDSAEACAEIVARLLKHQALKTSKDVTPEHAYFVSDDPEKFRAIGCEILGISIKHVERLRKS